MDLVCKIQQPNVFRGADSLRLHSRFRCGGFNRCGVDLRSPRKIRRSVLHSALAFRHGAFSSSSLFCGCGGGFVKVCRGVKLLCHGDDSLACVNGNGRDVEFVESGDESLRVWAGDGVESSGLGEGGGKEEGREEVVEVSLDELRELLQKAMRELEVARLNSIMFEEKAQRISEAAIASNDEAAYAWNDVNSALDKIQEVVNEECVAKETVQKATMALSLAEARLKVAVELLEVAKGVTDSPEGSGESSAEDNVREKDQALLAAQDDIRECQVNLANSKAELRRLQSEREELQKEVDRLNEISEKAQMNALKAEEDVANIMLLAEQAVAFELEAAQRVNDAEIALQREEKSPSGSYIDTPETEHVTGDEAAVEEEKMGQGNAADGEKERDLIMNGDVLVGKPSLDRPFDRASESSEVLYQSDDFGDDESRNLSLESPKGAEVVVAEKSKIGVQTKKLETQKDLTKESSPAPHNAPKALLNKSSRFFSASFFSFTVEGTEFTPVSVFQGLMESARKQLPKLVLGLLLFGTVCVLFIICFFRFFLHYHHCH